MRNILVAVCLLVAGVVQAETLKVGPNGKFRKPSKAIAAAKDGDVIEIDTSGDYNQDVAVIRRSNLTLRGVGEGRAKLDAKGMHASGKGIWVIKGNDVTVEKIEFIGARVPDNNGAGIRAEGKDLTVRNCRFHDCQDTILGGNGILLIEYCEFSWSGLSRHPVTHNLYISRGCDKLIYRFNYSHHSKIGHLLKSRAKESWVTYNRLSDEAEGTGSYVIDFPNGGKVYVIGNVLHKGPKGDNNTVVTYGMEGMKHKQAELYVVNNTIINEHRTGRFIRVKRLPDDFKMVVKNNIYVGKSKIVNWDKAVTEANLLGTDPMFVDRAKWNLALKSGSSCVNKGVDPGKVGDKSLLPEFQYVHPHGKVDRPSDGKVDIGAYEYAP